MMMDDDDAITSSWQAVQLYGKVKGPPGYKRYLGQDPTLPIGKNTFLFATCSQILMSLLIFGNGSE